MRRSPTSLALLVAGTVLLAACSGEEEVAYGAATVARGEVVQTVAAPAVLQPAARTVVTAPAGGEIETLAVAEGDVVAAGDPLLTLRSESLEQQLTQAEAAVEATGLLAGSGLDVGLGLDVGPIVGALRAQLDAVIPPVLGALEDQVAALEATITAVVDATQASGEATAAALRELAEALGGQLPPELGIDPELIAAPGAEAVTVAVDTSELEASLADARVRLAAAQREFHAASAQLGTVEADANASAAELAALQAAATEAQQEQAELAVAAVRDRLEDLAVVSPAAGIVALASADGGGAGAGIGGGLGDLGSLAAGLGGGELGGVVPDLGGLLGGAGAPPTPGPPTVGGTVSAGQQLLTILDLDAFTAQAEVDELDIVDVAVGQPVVVLVDALPGVELTGVVERIAIEPRRTGMGGAMFPITVRLTDLPADHQLRVGLSASVEIQVRRVEADLVVPSSALLRRGGDEVVHVVRDGIARRIGVNVLALGDGTAAIDGDLAVGDTVVTTGVELLEDGDPVLLDPDPVAP